MRKVYYIIIIQFVLNALLNNYISAQSLPVGTNVLDDYYRRKQLLGEVDSNLSFTVRPIFVESLNLHDIYDPDSTLKNKHWVKAEPVTFAKGLGVFQILPLTWKQQFNSNHPYGWNDGAMIPAKGYQTMLSGGIYLKVGPFSIQLMPEFVYADNPSFDGYASGHSDQDLISYYAYHNMIDLPERYGNNKYQKIFWGQSSFRLTFGAVSLGLSNENLWWGPGIRNSLILSNNAPGFKHLTLNTTRPIKTYIGSFEGQILAGRLDASGYPSLLTTTLSDGTNLLVNKRDDWRYFTGINLNYHPKWIPGLTLGLIRTFDSYHQDITSFSEYFPFFTPYQKVKVGINGDPIPRDQYTSVYSRWLFRQAQAEVYFEYGLNDNFYNLRDLISSPEHSRAYILGLRKMFKLNSYKNQSILFSTEITQLSQTVDRLVRNASGWYIHSEVLDGHTNQGQILGAGTGSGGNIQSMDVSWISGLKKLGVGLERYEHDVDFSDTYFSDINSNSRNWVDFAFAVFGEWDYKNLLLSCKLQEIKSLNYEWILKDYDSTNYYIPHNDVFNLHCELGVTFRF
ncbi:MAG: capsule assembly Wzi family protein [Janthinobacterium lividum]